MNTEAILKSVKIDLGISGNAYDARLREYITSSIAAIEREGISMSDDTEHRDVVARYAAWMWRKRDTGEGIPRMIRWQLNNLIFSGSDSE